jgi:thiamine transporter
METRKLVEIGIFVGIAIVLELISTIIPFLHMPQGGSLSLGMLPIFLIAYRYGIKEGMIAGFVFGIIIFILSGYAIHWGSIFFDYIFAFTALGFAGIFKKNALLSNKSFIAGIILGGFLRYIFHGLSGVIFFSAYAGDFNPWFYSFIVYNLPYMLASIILVIFVGISIKDRIFN